MEKQYNGHPSLRHWYAVSTTANNETLYNLVDVLAVEQWLQVVREQLGQSPSCAVDMFSNNQPQLHLTGEDVWVYAYNEIKAADNA